MEITTKNTTISISSEVSERIEKYCRVHGILKKDFVRLALECIESNDIDVKENIIVQGIRKNIAPINEVVMQAVDQSLTNNATIAKSVEAISKLLNGMQHHQEVLEEQVELKTEIVQKQSDINFYKNELEQVTRQTESLRQTALKYKKELQRIKAAGLFNRNVKCELDDYIGDEMGITIKTKTFFDGENLYKITTTDEK